MYRRPQSRRGYTLLEVISASIIIGAVMAPSVALLSNSLKTSREVESTNAMAILGASKLEEQLGISAKTFRDANLRGDFRAEGHRELDFRVTRSQALAAGGIPGSLMAVVVDVWHDRDNNNRMDAEEPRLQFASKVVRP